MDPGRLRALRTPRGRCALLRPSLLNPPLRPPLTSPHGPPFRVIFPIAVSPKYGVDPAGALVGAF